MAATLDAFAPRSGAAEGYRRFLQLSERLHDISERFFFWRSIGSIARHVRRRHHLQGLRAGRRPGHAHRPHRRRHRAEPRPRAARRPDARPLHPVRRLLPGRLARRALRHRPHADPGRHLVPPRRHPRRARGPRTAWPANSASRSAPAPASGASSPTAARVSGVETAKDGRIERVPLAAVVSNCDTVRTHRELLDGTRAARRFEKRRSYEPACSGVVLYLGLDRAYDHLLHHNFVFSRDPDEEFDAIYRQGEPAAGPDLLRLRPRRHRARRRPRGRRGPLRPRPHALPAPAPRLDDDAPRLPRGHPRQAREDRRPGGPRKRIVFESALTPQDIHDRYHVLNGAIYGLASHGRLLGAFKPGQPQPRRAGPLPRRRRRPPRSRHADGADVRLDRGGCAG